MALEDVLKAAVVKPVFLGFFDIDGDPIRAWTGPGILAPTGTGDALLDGFTFNNAAGLIAVSDFTENTSIGDQFSLTFSVADDELDPYAQLVANRDAFQGRAAVVWRVFLADDESAVLSYFDRQFAGVMVAASMNRQTGESGTITITCDEDLQKARVAPTRWIDHQFYYSTDTASSFINDLSRGPVTASVVASKIPAPAPEPPNPGWPWFPMP